MTLQEQIARERKRAIQVVANPHLHEPSYIAVCFNFLKIHGAK